MRNETILRLTAPRLVPGSAPPAGGNIILPLTAENDARDWIEAAIALDGQRQSGVCSVRGNHGRRRPFTATVGAAGSWVDAFGDPLPRRHDRTAAGQAI